MIRLKPSNIHLTRLLFLACPASLFRLRGTVCGCLKLLLLRSQHRRAHALEALAAWSQLSPADPEPRLEAAKYFEWEARDPSQALHWADQARQAVELWSEGWRRRDALASIDHRIRRLLGKVALPAPAA